VFLFFGSCMGGWVSGSKGEGGGGGGGGGVEVAHK